MENEKLNERLDEIKAQSKETTPIKEITKKEYTPSTLDILKTLSLKMLNNAIKESSDLSELVINGSTEIARSIALTLSKKFKA